MIRATALKTGLILTALLTALLFHGCKPAPVLEGSRPNIVFILADDMGWADLPVYGNRFNEAPNLTRMAENGMRFTDAYAACPVCSPPGQALCRDNTLHMWGLSILSEAIGGPMKR